MASSSNFEANPGDMSLAEEGYIRYLGGVVYLHDPEATADMHGRDFNEDRELFVAEAEQLMIEGAHQVIRFTNHPDRREKMIAIEDHYREALPGMLAVVRNVFSTDIDREKLLSPSVRFLRPAAFLHENIYKYLCHSRLGKIATTQMLDGVYAAEELRNVLEGRRLGKS